MNYLILSKSQINYPYRSSRFVIIFISLFSLSGESRGQEIELQSRNYEVALTSPRIYTYGHITTTSDTLRLIFTNLPLRQGDVRVVRRFYWAPWTTFWDVPEVVFLSNFKATSSTNAMLELLNPIIDHWAPTGPSPASHLFGDGIMFWADEEIYFIEFYVFPKSLGIPWTLKLGSKATSEERDVSEKILEDFRLFMAKNYDKLKAIKKSP